MTLFRTPVGAGAAAPHAPAREAGADTDAVLRDGGRSDDEITELRRAGVVHGRTP